MFLSDSSPDAIIEVLRLAYRRGLIIRREQEEKSKYVGPNPLKSDKLIEQEAVRELNETRPTLRAT